MGTQPGQSWVFAMRRNLARPEAAAWPQPGKTELHCPRLTDIRLVDDVVYFEVGPAGR